MGFSRQEYWSGCHACLQGIFPTQGSNLYLLHCRQILYHLSHQDKVGVDRCGLPCPPPGDLPNPGIEPMSLMSPALAGRFFTTHATWEAPGERFLPDPWEKDFVVDAWTEFSKPSVPRVGWVDCVLILCQRLTAAKTFQAQKLYLLFPFLEIWEACLRRSPWHLPQRLALLMLLLSFPLRSRQCGRLNPRQNGQLKAYLWCSLPLFRVSGPLEAPLPCEITMMVPECRDNRQSWRGWSHPDRWSLYLLADAAIDVWLELQTLSSHCSRGWESKSGCWEHFQDRGGKTLEACLPVHRNKVTSTQGQ